MQRQMLPYPQPTTRKPEWKKDFTSKDIEPFGKAMAQWEAEQASLQTQREAYAERATALNDCMREYLEYVANIKAVPEHYREKVWSNARQAGSWEDTYCRLRNLIEIFE